MTAPERFIRHCWPAAECVVVTEGAADGDGWVVVLNGVWLHARPEPTPEAAWLAANDAARETFAGEFC